MDVSKEWGWMAAVPPAETVWLIALATSAWRWVVQTLRGCRPRLLANPTWARLEGHASERGRGATARTWEPKPRTRP